MADIIRVTDDDFETKVIKVNAITGKRLLDNIGDEIDLCKIDVEGFTYEVLVSFGEDIQKIKSFHLECEQQVLWDGQKTYREVKTLLESLGFIEVFREVVWDIQYDCIWIHENHARNR